MFEKMYVCFQSCLLAFYIHKENHILVCDLLSGCVLDDAV